MFNKMFDNISKKIKFIAKLISGFTIFVCGFTVAVNIIIATLQNDLSVVVDDLITVAYILPVLLISSYMIYGFGQLIENTNSLNGVQVTQDEDEEENA